MASRRLRPMLPHPRVSSRLPLRPPSPATPRVRSKVATNKGAAVRASLSRWYAIGLFGAGLGCASQPPVARSTTAPAVVATPVVAAPAPAPTAPLVYVGGFEGPIGRYRLDPVLGTLTEV